MKNIYFLIILWSLNIRSQTVVPIPDIYFKTKVLGDATVNLNGDLEIQVTEASQAINLDLYNASINSLDGIEYFTNLQTLDCSFNNLITISPVLNLNNLTILDCSFNDFTTLNFVGLTNLQTLVCQNLTCNSLTFSNQLALKNLNFGGTITNVNLSSLVALQNAKCEFGSISSINVGTINLKKLEITSTTIGTFDFSSMITLEELYCDTNILSTITLGNLPNLKKFSCLNNQLSSINISGCTNLEIFNCQSNLLTQLNISGLSALRQLYCSNNTLNTIISDIANTSLQYIFCSNNNITNFNTSFLTGLIDLSCFNNSLTYLNVNNCTNLIGIDLDNNNLIDLSLKNNSIETSYDFGGNPNLLHICADPAQINDLQNAATFYGYNNCVVDSACSLSTSNPGSNPDFSIHPNPSNGRFTINYNNLYLNNSINLSVIDMQGRMVYAIENAITQVKTEINIENVVQSGIYFVKLNSNNYEKTVKIIVK